MKGLWWTSRFPRVVFFVLSSLVIWLIESDRVLAGTRCASALLGQDRLDAFARLSRAGYTHRLLFRNPQKGILLISRPHRAVDFELERDAHSGSDVFLGAVRHQASAPPIPLIPAESIDKIRNNPFYRDQLSKHGVVDVSADLSFLRSHEVEPHLEKSDWGDEPDRIGITIASAVATLLAHVFLYASAPSIPSEDLFEISKNLMGLGEQTANALGLLLNLHPGVIRSIEEGGNQIMGIRENSFMLTNAALAAIVAGVTHWYYSSHNRHNRWVRSREIDPALETQDPNRSASFIARWARENLRPERWLLVVYVDTPSNLETMSAWLTAREGYEVYE